MKPDVNSQKGPEMAYHTLLEWVEKEAITLSKDSLGAFDSIVDEVMGWMGDSVRLLGLGEALHGDEDILHIRNKIFKRLVEAHGYTAIALESSFPRGRLVNDFINDQRVGKFSEIEEEGFSHDFGALEGNQDLVEWMREYNSKYPDKLSFYGFDSPTEMIGSDSPREMLYFVLDYLETVGHGRDVDYLDWIDQLLGDDSAWENPAAMMDHNQSIGRSLGANALRVEIEDLICYLNTHYVDLAGEDDEGSYLEAVHYAHLTRELLNYHAVMAENTGDRTSRLLGIRDAMMAENLAYISSREQGNVLVFAHNSHLKQGKMEWQLGNSVVSWWPAGAHLNILLGCEYAAIGSAVGVSEGHGIKEPEEGTLEELLIFGGDPVLFIPTHKGLGLPEAELEGLSVRASSDINSSYFPLNPENMADFDFLMVLNAI